MLTRYHIVVDAESEEEVVARLQEAIGEHYEVLLSSEPTGLGFKPVILIRSKKTGEFRLSLKLRGGYDD